MNRRRTFGALSISCLIGSALLAGTSDSAQAACQLHSPNGAIKRVIHLTFDNVHLRRDNPNVPSDLEQQPNLLNFITSKGTMLSNHFTPLISHTSVDIITALTGVYGDRHGVPVGNSYGFFNADGSVGFTSSCGGSSQVATINGVNTLLLTATSTPLPDMITIDATPTKDGTLTLGTASAAGAIASAAINIGAAGTVTFTPTVTPFGQPTQTLPLKLTICQTNSAGACINPTTPGPSATIDVAANQTVLLTTFVQGQGTAIPFDPANNRIFLIGTSGGVAVGEASVAIKIQGSGSAIAQLP